MDDYSVMILQSAVRKLEYFIILLAFWHTHLRPTPNTWI